MELNKLQEFIGIVNSKIGSGYVYGGQNDAPLTREALDELVKKFGKTHYYFKSYSAEKWFGNEYYDCSGLIVYTLQKTGLIQNGADYTSQDIFSKLCTSITKDQLKAGDLCFQKSKSAIYHVGVYMGNNTVTHSRGTTYGVVNTSLYSSFNTFGRLNFFVKGYPEVNVIFKRSAKKVTADTDVFDKPDEKSNIIGKLALGSLVNAEATIDNQWCLVSVKEKKGYMKASVLADYDELLEALDFLSKKSGIDREIWYKQAKSTSGLDSCFIKIARGFGWV